jgi:hypothetical protein
MINAVVLHYCSKTFGYNTQNSQIYGIIFPFLFQFRLVVMQNT